jgi:hypothetical protein
MHFSTLTKAKLTPSTLLQAWRTTWWRGMATYKIMIYTGEQSKRVFASHFAAECLQAE